ncbi:MAG: methyltransferase domain-containing protein [Xanthobacteraceae bacterium]
MQLATKANKEFLATAEPRSANDWDTLLEYQVDLAFPQELEFLLALPAFKNATDILDAGCGNGYYLSRLQQFFPEKAYCGVDISPELIARGMDRYPAVSLSVGDIAAYCPARQFDLIIMRFVVQHLKDLDGILAAAGRLLKPSGSLLIIESDLARSANFPPLPAFTDMLHTFARVSADHGSLKPRLLASPHQLLAQTDSGWIVERDDCVTAAQTGPFTASKLLAVYSLWVDLCERSRMFAFDFDAVRKELQTWAARRAIFSTVALRMIVIKRREGRLQ